MNILQSQTDHTATRYAKEEEEEEKQNENEIKYENVSSNKEINLWRECL